MAVMRRRKGTQRCVRSREIGSVFSFIKNTREVKVTASVKNVFARGKCSTDIDFNGK